MTIKRICKVIVFVVPSFLFFACSKSSNWSSDQIYSEDKESCSTKLTYFSKDPVRGIDLEFLKIGDRLNVYLNIHSIPVPSQKSNPKSIQIKIKTADGLFAFEAYRFEGGQRFLLSEEACLLLIATLQNNKEATLILPGYHSIIEAEGFLKKFHRLHHPLPLKNPFHSPL